MRKNPVNYLIRQRRIVDDRLKRKNRRKKKKGITRARFIFGYEIIPAPKIFALFPESIDEVISFIRLVGKKDKTKKLVAIDFSKTTFMSALGAVYIHSEISNIQDTFGKSTVRIRTGTIPNHQVRNTLKNTGLFELCGHPITPDAGALPIIRDKDDAHIKKITEYLINTALFREQLIIDDRNYAERLVYKAIVEAMLNVKHHAYPGNNINNFWWITAAIIEEELHIALCDRGVGIPQTLSKKNWFNRIIKKKFIPGVDDAEMIKTAMEYARSSRKQHSGTGLGSRDIQQLVQDSGQGHLTIISGTGYYRLEGETKEEKVATIGYDVDGTLIQWRIPLPTPTGGQR